MHGKEYLLPPHVLYRFPVNLRKIWPWTLGYMDPHSEHWGCLVPRPMDAEIETNMQIWSNMIKHDQIWLNMIKYDQIWSNMIKYDHIANMICDLSISCVLQAAFTGRFLRSPAGITPRNGNHHPHLHLPNEERSIIIAFTIAIENGHLLLMYRFTY